LHVKIFTTPVATQSIVNYGRNVEYFGEIQKQQDYDAKTKALRLQYGFDKSEPMTLPTADQFKPKPSGEAPRIFPKGFFKSCAAIPNNFVLKIFVLDN
jgi:hypothetical protein